LSCPTTSARRSSTATRSGWRFSPGTAKRSWSVDGVEPPIGVWGAGEQRREVQLCYRVSDIGAAAQRIRQHGGQAGAAYHQPYGLMADCSDSQGIQFQLWQPSDDQLP
jgi:predicted enzyme related to lactoylglutathione lyase